MSAWAPEKKTALLLTDTGEQFFGDGIGATGHTVAEVCFHTGMTGYQEILTDPSYTEQIVTFTFPHIGNVGTNNDDVETSNIDRPRAANGLIIREAITKPDNYRSQQHLDSWLKDKKLIGLSGIDTRAITTRIRENGMFNAVLAHDPDSNFDIPALQAELDNFAGIEGADLTAKVTMSTEDSRRSALSELFFDKLTEGRWPWGLEFSEHADGLHVIALDYGMKENILRCLVETGCHVSVLPADSTAETVLEHNPDGIFLSNGPGDPAATSDDAVGQIKKLVACGKPVFGICFGHQLLARAFGARTMKMKQGHHGANHPVKDLATGKVEITSMNHGFTVDRDSLPETVEETHISLFDGTNCGIQLKDQPVFSVQYHPEASPGPQDSHYLFDRFVSAMKTQSNPTNNKRKKGTSL